MSVTGPARSVRSIALGILVRVERDRAHAAPLIDARGRGLPARDRDLLRALVKRTLRGAIRLDHVLARSCDRPVASLDVVARSALRLGAAQLLLLDRVPPHAAVAETVEAVKELAPKAAGLVNAVLRKVASREERPGAVVLPGGADVLSRMALETSHPEWLVRRWVAHLGEADARAALASGDVDTPMDLLADPRAGTVAEILARLAADGVEARRSAWAPLALTAAGDAAGHPLVTSGALAVVDAAAQAVCELVAESDLVVDLAAAPGGKTRTILARERSRRVLALERVPSRAARLVTNLVASGRAGEAWVVHADSAVPPLPPGRFASVLLDAPCSGTGTLRKNPEIRLRLLPADLAGLAAVQRTLIAAALSLLAPGGRLTYVTCSLEPEENEEAVDAVLSFLSGFEREEIDPTTLPVPLAACARGKGLFRVVPGAENDGFTALAIRRAGSSRFGAPARAFRR